ncbi:MAG: cysteine dioxygenase [Betaproteobacteria bacterium]|nr:cysteine dioxygenase [Betaproteobacteria bacterium]
MHNAASPTSIDPIRPLREFVADMTRLIERTDSERELLAQARPMLATLIRDSSWLPQEFSQAEPGSYRQYLLYCDALERFSVVSFVWGPGATTPVHDHTVWGLVGILKGEEMCCEYTPDGPDRVRAASIEHSLKQGMIEAVSPTVGDWHQVRNPLSDQTSISIHVYGGNIGSIRRHRIDAASGQMLDFISGYSSALLPNLWDRSAAVRAAAR